MGAQHGTALKHSQLYMNLAIVLPQPGVRSPSSHPSFEKGCSPDCVHVLCCWVPVCLVLNTSKQKAWCRRHTNDSRSRGKGQTCGFNSGRYHWRPLSTWLGAMQLDTSLIITAQWLEREEIILSAWPDAVDTMSLLPHQLLVFVFSRRECRSTA